MKELTNLIVHLSFLKLILSTLKFIIVITKSKEKKNKELNYLNESNVKVLFREPFPLMPLLLFRIIFGFNKSFNISPVLQ